MLSGVNTAAYAARATIRDASDNAAWLKLKQQYFGDRPIHAGDDVVALKAPYRAEDPAVVPITITDRLKADADRHIVRLWLVIDHNPEPMSARITFGPAAADATLSTRVRVNTYTNMRVIAETNDHALYMAKRFVKASGGCSAPVSRDPETALAHMGEMRLRHVSPSAGERAAAVASRRVALLIRHPNITGLQLNQLTRLIQPAHYVDAITVHDGDALVFDAHMTFSLSQNPSLRFAYRDGENADTAGLDVKVHDNKDNVFTQRWSAVNARTASTEDHPS